MRTATSKIPGDIGLRIFELINTKDTPITKLTKHLVDASYFTNKDAARDYILKIVATGKFLDEERTGFVSEDDCEKLAVILHKVNVGTNTKDVNQIVSSLGSLGDGEFNRLTDELGYAGGQLKRYKPIDLI